MHTQRKLHTALTGRDALLSLQSRGWRFLWPLPSFSSSIKLWPQKLLIHFAKKISSSSSYSMYRCSKLGGGLPTRQGKARPNSTTEPVAAHCSANKRKQRHSFNHSLCTPSSKPVPLQPRGPSKHKVSPFSSLFNKTSFNLSIAAMSNMTLLQGVGGRAVAAPCAAAECPSCQYQCRVAHSYMPAGGRPRVGLWFLRSRIDILMLVRNWHSCLQRPSWLSGREHKWPTLLSLLTSVASAFPSVFQKLRLSR